nr:MAG TPA: hypothetical protein [Caudoviricetes sp.]
MSGFLHVQHGCPLTLTAMHLNVGSAETLFHHLHRH